LESGPLSDPKFPAFAKDVIPYLNIATHIEGHPYDKLLQEKGFGGYPSLAFMDAEGEILAVQGDRSVDGFRNTYNSVQAYADLQARVAAGEKGLGVEMMVAEWDLGKLKWEDAKKRADGFDKLTAKQKKVVGQIVLDAEVVERAKSTRDEEKAKAVYARFKELADKGYMPGEKAEGAFWRTILNGADQAEDVKLYGAAVAWMTKTYGDNPRAKDYLQGLADRLAEMEGDSAAGNS